MMAAEELSALADKLRNLSTASGEAIAKAATSGVESAVQTTARAGTTPDGKAWEPKKSGGRALINAAGAVSAKAVGAFVVLILRTPYVWHHRAKGKTTPRREILPDPASGHVPESVLAPIRAAARDVVRGLMR